MQTFTVFPVRFWQIFIVPDFNPIAACEGNRPGGGVGYVVSCDSGSLHLILYTSILASTTLITVPASVASSAPVRVNRVLVTFAARKYTLMV